uniref:Uncharacterized protein n=1 Tax=Arundo donax TaxID=35708 RepID=A0A0A9FCX7_ARUDO
MRREGPGSPWPAARRASRRVVGWGWRREDLRASPLTLG